MTEEFNHDMTCVPYRRVWLYFLLTIPLLAMMGLTAYILWTYWYVYMIIYVGLYGSIILIQSYCCMYQDCPYTGGFCPAIAGIIPASFLGKLLEKLKVKKNKTAFQILVALGELCLFALVVFPLYWLFIYNIIAFIGYLVMIMLYAFAFLMAICPACAIRDTCPGGKASNALRRVEKEDKENTTKKKETS